MLLPFIHGRGDWIRTSGLYVPNVALYQAEPHLEKLSPVFGAMAAEEGFEPSQTESESVVLPLHNSASTFAAAKQHGLLYQNIGICQPSFEKKMQLFKDQQISRKTGCFIFCIRI